VWMRADKKASSRLKSKRGRKAAARKKFEKQVALMQSVRRMQQAQHVLGAAALKPASSADAAPALTCAWSVRPAIASHEPHCCCVTSEPSSDSSAGALDERSLPTDESAGRDSGAGSVRNLRIAPSGSVAQSSRISFDVIG